jgi:hypothetical protein
MPVDEGIKYDLRFIKSHKLQPEWYKVLKVFILAGFLVGLWYLFGITTTLVAGVIFIFFALLIHMLYRAKTKRFTQSWLDFEVVQDGKDGSPKRIGPYYYVLIILAAILSLIFSLLIT